MRLAVDAPSLGDSAVTFERANQSAAAFHTSLHTRLSGCGAMAGDSCVAADFASAYDDAAQLALDSVADLVDAFATCGRLTSTCATNHARAEARSVISGPSVLSGSLPARGYVSVLPASLPSSLGSDSTLVPGWAAWILEQVEGFVWPDADLPRLRHAASTWRTASSRSADLASFCSTAVSSLALTLSPEIPLAVDVTERLARHCHSVSDQCAVLARSCEAYADHVESARAEILDLVHDLLRDAVVIQGIGLVLGIVTGGTTAAAAAALNAAKIATAAPRLLRILSALRALAASCAAPVRVSVVALRDVRRDLVVFRRARISVAAEGSPEGGRLARLRTVLDDPRRFDPVDLRGLSKSDIKNLCDDWSAHPSSRSEGVVYEDPSRLGRQIRVMDGCAGNGADQLTHGPYAVVSQNGRPAVKIPLWGKSDAMRTRADIVATLLDEIEEYYDPFEHYPLYLLTWHLRGESPNLSPAAMHDIAQEVFGAFRAVHPSRVVGSHWPIDLGCSWPLDPGTVLDFDLDPEGPLDQRLQVLVPDTAR